MIRTPYDETLLGTLDRRFLERRPAKFVLALILLAAMIAPSIQAAVRITRTDKTLFRAAGERHQTALGRWLPTARALRDGGDNPYGQGHWFPTPPFVLICLVPFEAIGYQAAGIAWAALKIIAFLSSMALLLRSLRHAGFDIPMGILLAAGVFAIRPVISDLQHANLNLFMVAWIALAWAFYLQKRDLCAGLFLALAIVTKVTPGLLLLYFLYKRQWRVCLAAGAGLLLFVILLPGMILGFSRNLTLLIDWFHLTVAPYALHGWATIEIANQSLYGVLMRLLSNAGRLSLEHMPLELALASGMEDMARPATTLGGLLRPLITLSLLGLLAWTCRWKGPRDSIRSLLELSLVLLAMLLMGERTWKHHATTLPIVYLSIWYAVACVDWSPRFRGWMVALLVVQFVLLVAGGEGVFGDVLADRMLDGGFFCWGLVTGLVQTALLAHRAPERVHPHSSI